MMGAQDQPWAMRIVASVGVLASIGVACWYALVAALTVPFPEGWVFVAAGLSGILLAVRWWGSRPWWALLTPIVTYAALTILRAVGEANWGWGP